MQADKNLNSVNRTSLVYSAIIVLLSIGLVVFVLLPVLSAAHYIVPAADDFSNGYKILEIKGNHSYLWAALKESIELYRTTSGYVFGAFVNYIISPCLRWGIQSVGIVTMLSDALYFLSLLYLVRALMCEGLGERRWTAALPVWALLVFCSVELDFHSEAYLWYCCSAGYVIPISLGYIGLGQFITALNRGGTWHAVAAGVLGLLASETSLDVTALFCSFYLIAAVWSYIIRRRQLMSTLVFGAVLLGAAVNVASPGNYLRHDSFPGHLGFWDVFSHAWDVFIARFATLFATPYLPLILAALFLFGVLVLFRRKTLARFWPLLLLGGFAVSVYLTIFPVVYGYNGYFPDRCKFVTDNAVFLGLFFWVLGFSGWCRHRIPSFDPNEKTVGTVFSLLLLIWSFCVFYTGVVDVRTNCKSYPSVHITQAICNGQMANFLDYWTGILDEVAASAQKSIVVVRDTPVVCPYLISPGFTDDENNWVNQSVVNFYFEDKTGGANGVTLRFFSSKAAYKKSVAETDLCVALADGEEMYSDGNTKILLYDDCLYYVESGSFNDDAHYFLELYPADDSDATADQTTCGFNNSDFKFSNFEVKTHANFRVAIVPLPDYEVARISTGQSDETKGVLWNADFNITYTAQHKGSKS